MSADIGCAAPKPIVQQPFIRQQVVLALADIVEGLAVFRVWNLLATTDIRLRYRRTTLGAFWVTLSMGVFVAAISLVFGGLFQIDAARFVPFLTAGFILWGLLSNAISGSCLAFVNNEEFIKCQKMPFSIYIYRVLWENIIIMGHNAVIYIVVMFIFHVNFSSTQFLFIPGIFLLLMNILWVMFVLGPVCARYRDMPQIVANILQVAFYVTPIIWEPSLLAGRRSMIVDWNPLYYIIEVARAPLLGAVPPASAWLVSVILMVFGWLFALTVFALCRRRLSYWI